MIYLVTPEQLRLIGQAVVPETTVLEFAAGWNMIPYLRTNPINVTTALAQIDNHIIILKNSTGEMYFPIFGINSLETNSTENYGKLMPGKAYLLYTTQDVSFVYPPNSYSGIVSGNSKREYQPETFVVDHASNPNNATIIAVNQSIPDGSEIGIFNSGDELIGSGAFRNGRAAANVIGQAKFGDDFGAKENEKLSIRLLDKLTGEIATAKINYINNMITGANEKSLLYKKDAILKVEIDFDDGNFTNDVVISPNPSDGEFRIKFSIAEASEIEIKLFDEKGSRVANIFSGNSGAGLFELSRDLSSISSGKYLVNLTINGRNYAYSLLIAK